MSKCIHFPEKLVEIIALCQEENGIATFTAAVLE